MYGPLIFFLFCTFLFAILIFKQTFAALDLKLQQQQHTQLCVYKSYGMPPVPLPYPDAYTSNVHKKCKEVT